MSSHLTILHNLLFMCHGTHLCIKFIVPSMGSTIQVGVFVRTHDPPSDTDSSPIKLPHTQDKKYAQVKIKVLVASCLIP